MNFDSFLIGFLALAAIERLWERRYSRQALRGQQKMKWSYAALHFTYIAIFAATAMEYFWLRRQVLWLITGFGLMLFVVALVIRIMAIRTLGHFWSLQLEIRQNHTLVTDGPYRYVRHPAYLAMMLEIVSIPLVANSYYTVALAIGTFVPLLLMRWRREEQEMIKKCGEQYEQYRKQVPAFLPWRWKGRNEQKEKSTVNPFQE